MNDLLDTVMGQLDERTLAGLGRQVGADPAATRNAVAASLPLLLGAMQRNAGAGGADALARALERDHANASVDDRLDAALGGNTQDGAAILGHVLGGRQQRAALGVSKVSGLEPGQSGKLMAMLAPIVMAMLANMQRRQGAAGGSGIEGLLGQVMGGLGGGAGTGSAGGSGVSGLLGAVLDRDGDGDVDFQDLMAAGSGGSGSGFDGLLGGRR